MSRQIDLTKPLSDEDREYLVARARHRDITLADANAKGEEPPAPPTPNDAIASATDRSPEATPAAAGARDGAVGATPPEAGSAGGSADRGTEPDDNYDDESVWSYEDIKTEVKDRDAEDKPALNSSRSDLIAWLRQDDAAE